MNWENNQKQKMGHFACRSRRLSCKSSIQLVEYLLLGWKIQLISHSFRFYRQEDIFVFHSFSMSQDTNIMEARGVIGRRFITFGRQMTERDRSAPILI